MSHETQPAFNLLDEPWILVRTLTGEVHNMSLTQVLLEADQIAALAETSPPNLIALYRILLAVLHRALTTHHGRWKDADRARWYREGLPAAPIRAYLEQWRERFWLFHPENPFMQVAALADAPETQDKHKPWTQLTLESTSGNNPLVFDHSVDEKPTRISPGSAVRHMLGYFQFAPGGPVKVLNPSGNDTSGPLANSAAIVPIDNVLSKSLVLSLHPCPTRNFDDDLPTWEKLPPILINLRALRQPASGYNDLYTRLIRTVLLLPEGDLAIREICFAEGVGLSDDINLPDPMISQRTNMNGELIKIGFRGGRATWRDLPALLPGPAAHGGFPAPILGWACNAYEALREWDRSFEVVVAGVAMDKMKCERWRSESFVLPRQVLANPELTGLLRQFAQQAEDVHWRLRQISASMIAEALPVSGERTRSKTGRDKRSIEEKRYDSFSATVVFFSVVERIFYRLVPQIAHGEVEAADHEWRTTLVEAGWQSWEAALQSLGDSPIAWKARARALPKTAALLKSIRYSAAEPTQDGAIP